jgi:hypothetical protein
VFIEYYNVIGPQKGRKKPLGIVRNMNFNLLHLHESVTCLIMNYNMNSIENILTRLENFYIRIELSFFYEVSHDVSCLRTKHTPTEKLVRQDGLPKLL